MSKNDNPILLGRYESGTPLDNPFHTIRKFITDVCGGDTAVILDTGPDGEHIRRIINEAAILFDTEGVPHVPADGSVYTQEEWDALYLLRDKITPEGNTTPRDISPLECELEVKYTKDLIAQNHDMGLDSVESQMDRRDEFIEAVRSNMKAIRLQDTPTEDEISNMVSQAVASHKPQFDVTTVHSDDQSVILEVTIDSCTSISNNNLKE